MDGLKGWCAIFKVKSTVIESRQIAADLWESFEQVSVQTSRQLSNIPFISTTYVSVVVSKKLRDFFQLIRSRRLVISGNRPCGGITHAT